MLKGKETNTALPVSNHQTVPHKHAQLVYVKARKSGEEVRTTAEWCSKDGTLPAQKWSSQPL